METFEHFVYISEAVVAKTFGWNEAVDEKSGAKYILLEGEFQRADAKNKNSRIYSEALLRRETDRMREIIAQRNGHPMGMDHPIPDPNDPNAVMKIKRVDLSNACALTTNLEMNNKIVYGQAKILSGDYGTGDKLAAYVRNGFKPAVSSRGVGGKPQLNPTDAAIYVPESFKMICYDFVLDPSTHNAILEEKVYHEMAMLEHEIHELSKGRGHDGKSNFFSILNTLANKHSR